MTLWIGVKHEKKEALELFTREIAPSGTGMGEQLSFSMYDTLLSILFYFIDCLVHRDFHKT